MFLKPLLTVLGGSVETMDKLLGCFLTLSDLIDLFNGVWRFPPSSLRLPSELTLLLILETVQDPLPEEIPDPTGVVMPE